ncbi:MAG TPA: PAS domain S-box protein [Pyrinomonadaceae bacterium]|jgi:PAS domain S-box-containing protein
MPFYLLPDKDLRIETSSGSDAYDAESKAEFDDLIRLAALIFGASKAFVSSIDGDLRFESQTEIDTNKILFYKTFASSAIFSSDEFTIVEDATEDERFCSNRMLAGEPQIRFCVAAPLISFDGDALGSLWVIDYEKRTVSAAQLSALRILTRRISSNITPAQNGNTNNAFLTRYRQLLANASDGIHLFDFEGRIIGVNQKFCELTGRTKEELLNLHIQDLVTPEELTENPIGFAALQNDESRIVERVFVRPDGGIVPVEISCKKIDDNTIQAIARDITKRKKIESRLVESEQRFRSFVNNSLALFCTHDMQGVILSVNPAACAACGYAEDELVGRNLADLLLLDEKTFSADYLERIKTDGKLRGLMPVRTKNGESRIWLYNNIVTRDEENREYILGSALDVSEIKRNEEKLKKSQEMFNLYVNNSPAVIFLKDETGRYIKINRTFEKNFQRDRKELEGKTDFDIFPREVAESVRTNDRIVLETGKMLKAVEIVPTRDGTLNYWLSHKFLIENEEGEKLVGGISINITERKQTEDELRAARDAALESARLKSAFLTNVSHELRTPMNGVLGMTELLLETPLDRTQRDYAETIRQSGDMLLTVINDILDLAKIEAGKLRFETVDFDVRETVESTIEMLSPRAFGKNIEIASLIDENVPRIVRGDPGRLRQVLTNLAGNAVKYTVSGGVRVEVKTLEEKSGQTILRFDVIDTGIGIDEKNLKNLFQPFVQIDNSTTRQYGGTGLGLVISKQIVEMMSGEISVESEPNKGSRFSFTASFTKKSDRSEGENAALPLTRQLKGKRILIADANPVTCRNLEQYCRIWNLEPIHAENGEEVLRKLRQAVLENRAFDYVLIDLNLPDWDGFSLVRRIKTEAILAPSRIIVTTALGQRGDAAEAQKIGIAAYLTKPVRGSQLLECLSAILTEDNSTAGTRPPADLITRHSLRESRTERNVAVNVVNNKPFRILVVEDNEVNRRVLLEQLKKAGVTADFAVDGVDALEKIAAANYDLVLMDCQMPRMDGYEATRRIRLREQEQISSGEAINPLVIIALTAHTLAGEREKCLAAGMNDYLSKPAKISELSAILQYWRERSSAVFSPDDSLPQKSANTSLQITPQTRETFTAADAETAAPPDDTAVNQNLDEEIIRLYIKETSARIEEMKQAARHGKIPAIARFAHAVRGNSLAVGAAKIAKVAAFIEKSALENEIGRIYRLIACLNEEFSAFKKDSSINS